MAECTAFSAICSARHHTLPLTLNHNGVIIVGTAPDELDYRARHRHMSELQVLAGYVTASAGNVKCELWVWITKSTGCTRRFGSFVTITIRRSVAVIGDGGGGVGGTGSKGCSAGGKKTVKQYIYYRDKAYQTGNRDNKISICTYR